MSGRRLPPLPSLQELIRLYQLSAKKQLSQNFLLDMNLTRKIVRAAGNLTGSFVSEVGPGPGGITRALLDTEAQHIAVIEKDGRFLPSLQLLSEAAGGRLSVYHGDILNFNMEEVIPSEFACTWESSPPNVHIVGNLPFSVSTPLLIRWLVAISNQSGPWQFGRTRLTLTFQKEVAERMVARVNTNQRCRLSLMCQYLCQVQLKFIIPGHAFVPAPKVDVAVVHLVPRTQPLITLPFHLVQKVAQHIYHHRQKYCRFGVQTLFPPERLDLVAEMFEVTEVDPECRPYALTIRMMGSLCQAYHDICQREPDIYMYNFRSKHSARDVRMKNQLLLKTFEAKILCPS